MALSRKHFEVLAEALSYVNSDHDRQNATSLVTRMCRDENPAFDLTRFHAAIDGHRALRAHRAVRSA